ncbi:MAG TPA: hypothetical protein VGF45_04370 [Polyangia bacterium]
MGLLGLGCLAGALAACAPPPPGDQGGIDEGAEARAGELRGDRPPAFRDAEESFTNEDDQNRWFELRHGLNADFDDICGDTFCEGDFTNLASMRFRCSVSTRTGLLKNCLWLFAGSYETVTASTGNIRPTAKFFSCSIPVAGSTRQLLDALLAPSTQSDRGPLYRQLPGSTKSIYDHLGDCL